MALSDGSGCPTFDGEDLENGKESYGNITMAVKEVSPPGLSGTAQMPLGLTNRLITVTGLLVGDDTESLAEKQAAYEAKCETFLTGVFITANGREFETVRWVSVVWGEIKADAVSESHVATYTAIFIQLGPSS